MSGGAILPDKIQLLIEETGCDRAEAELAMSLAGFDLEKAIRTIGTLLRHIVVLKGAFADKDHNRHGLLILLADTRREHLFRVRAVVSYNPALHELSLTLPWYEFERGLYASRLSEGALQQVSQDLERELAGRLEGRRKDYFEALRSPESEALARFLNEALRAAFPRAAPADFQREVINWDQFRRFPIKGENEVPAPPAKNLPGTGALSDPLRVELEAVVDPRGMAVSDVKPGDTVSVVLTDPRDVARYLAKLLGALDETGPRPFYSPVEALERVEGYVRLQCRLSSGILGLVNVADSARVRVRRRGANRWWARWVNREPKS